MKKLFLTGSLVSILVWFAGVFLFSLDRYIHFFIALSTLMYVRFMMAPATAKWKEIFSR